MCRVRYSVVVGWSPASGFTLGATSSRDTMAPFFERSSKNWWPPGTRTRDHRIKKSDCKPINYNKLQHTINRNNKKRTDLRAAQIASECGPLLAKTVVCRVQVSHQCPMG